MGSVRVITAARAEEIESRAVVSGFVDLQGNLILKRNSGFEINAGRVQGPPGPSPYFPGQIITSAASLPPVGFLTPNGSAISRTEYPDLFAAIGTQYGVGDGSTTFNLPNLLGRVIAMVDATQPEFQTGGVMFGAKQHTLTLQEMPSHDHAMRTPQWFAADETSGGGMYSPPTSPTRAGVPARNTTSRGAGAAHNNIQPTIALYSFIKA